MCPVGVYVCEVKETVEERTVKKNISVTVLGKYTHTDTHTGRNTHTDRFSPSTDRGYVYLWSLGQTNVSSLLHHTVEFSVEVDAHPVPTFHWTKDNQTIAKDTTSITTTQLTGSR